MANKKPIDWDQFDKLCALQCTKLEIASFFDMSDDTLSRRVKESFDCTFAELYDQKKLRGRVSIRRKQYEMAMAGDRSLLIWIGKNWLGQSDKLEQSITGDPINIEFIKTNAD